CGRRSSMGASVRCARWKSQVSNPTSPRFSLADADRFGRVAVASAVDVPACPSAGAALVDDEGAPTAGVAADEAAAAATGGATIEGNMFGGECSDGDATTTSTGAAKVSTRAF